MTATAVRRTAIGAVVATALVLYGWGIGGEGWGNLYYAASVRSMNRSWSGFLFGTFDPTRLVTTDKPPLALWIQVGFVRLFGYHGWVLLAPQAIEGAATVWLLYLAVARWAGHRAGLIAAIVLTVTPIVVAINRDNNPDPLLMLVLVAAAYTATRALSSPRPGWLVGTGALIAVATLAKSLTAWMVVPAVIVAYLAGRPGPLRPKLVRLLAFGAVIVGATLLWPTLVDVTPASQRPYVEGSTHNSELELTFLTNGLDRALSTDRPAEPVRHVPVPVSAPVPVSVPGSVATAARTTRPVDTPAVFVGHQGPLRLLGGAFRGQIGWLLPLAALAGLVGLWTSWPRRHAGLEFAGWVLWSCWLATTASVISLGGGVTHVYYANELAPAIAALVGAGLVRWARAWRAGHRLGWMLPGAVGASALLGAVIARHPAGHHRWLGPAILAAGAASVGLFLLDRLRRPSGSPRRNLPRAAAALGAVALLIGPMVWSLDVVGHPSYGSDPRAGPVRALPSSVAAVDAVRPALAWFDRHAPADGDELALTTTADAAPWVVAGGRSVVGLGGYFGGEAIPSTSGLRQLIRAGRLHDVLVDPTLPTSTVRLIETLCRRQPEPRIALPRADVLYRCGSETG